MNQTKLHKSRLLFDRSAQRSESRNSSTVADLDTGRISRILMENLKDAVVIVDLKGRGLFANKAAEKLSGYTRKEMYGNSVRELILPQYWQLCDRLTQLALGERSVPYCEMAMRRKNGQIIDVETGGQLVRSKNGSIVGILIITRDISRTKKAESSLRENVERYRNLFESSPNSLLELDFSQIKSHFDDVRHSGIHDFSSYFEKYPNAVSDCARMVKIIDVNRAALRMYAARNKEELQKNLLQVLSDESYATFKQELIAIAEGKTKFESEAITQTLKEEKNRIVITWTTAPGCEMTCSRIFVSIKNVSKCTEIEDAMKRSEERYTSLVESSGFGVAIVDFDGRFTFVNKALCRVVGYSQKEIIGKNFSDFLHKEDAPKMASIFLDAWAHPDRKPRLEFRAIHKKGHVVHMYSTPTLYRINGKIVGFSAILVDITERRKLEEKLSTLNLYGGKLNTADSFEEIFTLVLDAIDRILGFGYAEIDLTDEGTLRVVSQRGYKGSICALRLDSETIGIVGKAAKLRKPILVPDVRVDKDYLAGYPSALSELAVPIISESEVLGVLNVESTELNAFGENDIALLEILASHAATALSNLRRREEIKEALRHARESEQKYRDIFENARDLILTTDINGNITSANGVLSETGYDRSEVIGQSVFNFVSEKSVQDLRDSLQRLFDRKSAKGELRIKSRIGTEAIVEYNGNIITQNGEVVGFQVIMRDVTQRKQMEEKLKQYSINLEEIVRKRTKELQESERKYSTLVEELSDGVAIIQDEGIIFINKRGLNLLQYSKDEVIGTPFEKFANDKYRRLVKERCKPRKKQGNVSPTYEANLVTKNGEELVIEICVKTIRYKGRPAVLCVFRDIRERKQVEEQRLRLEKMATLGEVATMVAHDLRNPLTAIRNAGFYIRKNCPHQTDAGCVDVLEMLNIIEQETIFADNIINDLLGFTAKELTQKQKQDMNKLLESSLKRLNIPDDIEIEKNFSEDASVTVDSKQIERLFVNLLRNAVQAMSEGGRLTITTKKEEAHLTVTIADTGVGVPKENMSRLFQPLFTTKSKGIGLGLAISKRIAAQHAGTIDVTSEVGKGTTFTLKLPIVLEAASK